jgi:hypothetical protein
MTLSHRSRGGWGCDVLIFLASLLMAVATGTFNIGTGAAGTTVDVTNADFGGGTPTVAIFMWSGRTATGQAEGHHKFGVGWAVSTTDQGCGATQAEHGSPTADADTALYDNACIALLTIAGAVDGKADFQSWLTNGVRLVIEDAFTASYLIHYLFLGGDHVGESVTVQMPTAVGDQDIVTPSGFPPDCIIAVAGNGSTAINSITTSANLSIGAATLAEGASIDNALLSSDSRNNADPTATDAYCRRGELTARVNISGTGEPVSCRASVTARLATGFRLNWAEHNTNGFRFFLRVLCLRGGRYAIGSALTNALSATTAFPPKALLVASHAKAESTVDTVQAHDERSLGFATADAQNYVSIIDKDNEATTDIGVAAGTDGMYASQSSAVTPAIEGRMSRASLDAAGFTWTQPVADPASAFFWYLAIGPAEVSLVVPPHPMAALLVR